MYSMLDHRKHFTEHKWHVMIVGSHTTVPVYLPLTKISLEGIMNFETLKTEATEVYS
jgi:hypothetical protein